MPFKQQTFDEAVWRIVTAIPAGQVMGYGAVARAAGFPRHARMVSRALGRASTPLPWYRVVRSDRTLAFEVGSDPYTQQKTLLESEGVQVVGRKVILLEPDQPVDIDQLLWGPDHDLS